ncbi:MAG: hypothetical protein GY811_14050 [Myxococcales bacterium]|nr:hypothetical protein [Myxococcales bacterium]
MQSSTRLVEIESWERETERRECVRWTPTGVPRAAIHCAELCRGDTVLNLSDGGGELLGSPPSLAGIGSNLFAICRGCELEVALSPHRESGWES